MSYTIRVPKGKKDAAERALEIHGQHCPVSQSVRRGIEVEFTGQVIEE